MASTEYEKIKNFKLAAEANVVAIIYKNPKILQTVDIKLDMFTNNTWKVYYSIAEGVINEGKQTLDEITVGLYLDKHPRLKEKYIDYGGYETLEKAKTYVKEENIDGYIGELKKYGALLKLAERGFSFGERLKNFVDMNAEEIYDVIDAMMNDAFVNAEVRITTDSANKGLEELIDRLDEGAQVGMPLNGAPMLTDTIGGLSVGNVYGFGANSGNGKSTLSIMWILTSIIKYNKKCVLIINEEDADKVKKELLIWVANNILYGYEDSLGTKRLVKKKNLRDGHFSPELKDCLIQSAKYIEEKANDKTITIVPLETYTCSTAVKIIRKYSSMGVDTFIIDTFKESADIGANEQTWKSMERDMRELYDTVKPASKNVTLWTTYQLSKGSMKTRHLTNADIGQAKSIVDVMSANILMRRAFDDEYEDGKNELTAYKLEGKSKIPFKLNRDKTYEILFIGKNRFGPDNYEIIAEVDLDTDTYKDLGIVYVPEDF